MAISFQNSITLALEHVSVLVNNKKVSKYLRTLKQCNAYVTWLTFRELKCNVSHGGTTIIK